MLRPIASALLVIPAACGAPAPDAAEPVRASPVAPAEETPPAELVAEPEEPEPAPAAAAPAPEALEVVEATEQDSEAEKELERVTEEVKAQIEELRGERFTAPVKVSVSGAEEFRAYVKQRLETTTTPEELAAEEELAKLLGLLPADFDYMAKTLELMESQVGGFYDPGTKAFYLMEGFDDIARLILSHELTHALDDQLFDLDAVLDAGNLDAEWAAWAVVEGSGTAVMSRWMIKHPKEVDLSALQDLASRGMEGLDEAPSFLWKPLVGAYTKGDAFLAKRPDDLELSAAIRRAFEEPPRSSEQILHPEKYWDAEKRDEPLPVRFERGPLPEGWEVLGENTLGELVLGLFSEPPEKRNKTANLFEMAMPRLTFDASEGWGGDRWLLLGRGDADRALVLATVWDTEGDAQEFLAAVQGLSQHIEDGAADALDATVDGKRVLVAITRGAGSAQAQTARRWARFE